jgi:chemotaxis protein methyltransferase CheR
MSNTNHALPNNRIEQLVKKIETETGLSFAGTKSRDLQMAIHAMAESLGMAHDADCIDWLISDPWDRSKADLCALHLTIGETYFFREPRAFSLVCDYAREKIRIFGAQNARLRIWSAGCCTGEEPHSIAMALRQGVPELHPGQLSILGTDITPDYLQLARTGMYRHWSFRNTEAALQKSNFSTQGNGQFQLNSEIRQLVKFSELNLAAPVYPSVTTDTHAMDIIFCRNVLMYFSKAQALNVIERFRQCLVDGGWLIVSPSEASAELFSGFSSVNFPDAIYFRKNNPLGSPMGVQHRLSNTSLVQSRKNGMLQQPVPGTKGAAAAPREPAVDIDIGNAAAASSVKTHSGAKPGQVRAAPQPLGPTAANAPASSGPYHAKALIAMEAGNRRDAIQNLRRALYLQPDSIIAHYLMGTVLSAEGKQRAASRQFEITMRFLVLLEDDEIVPESEGWSAACLRASVSSFLQKGNV